MCDKVPKVTAEAHSFSSCDFNCFLMELPLVSGAIVSIAYRCNVSRRSLSILGAVGTSEAMAWIWGQFSGYFLDGK